MKIENGPWFHDSFRGTKGQLLLFKNKNNEFMKKVAEFTIYMVHTLCFAQFKYCTFLLCSNLCTIVLHSTADQYLVPPRPQ